MYADTFHFSWNHRPSKMCILFFNHFILVLHHIGPLQYMFLACRWFLLLWKKLMSASWSGKIGHDYGLVSLSANQMVGILKCFFFSRFWCQLLVKGLQDRYEISLEIAALTQRHLMRYSSSFPELKVLFLCYTLILQPFGCYTLGWTCFVGHFWPLMHLVKYWAEVEPSWAKPREQLQSWVSWKALYAFNELATISIGKFVGYQNPILHPTLTSDWLFW